MSYVLAQFGFKMGKLGKKARKFAKKNLQSVEKRYRKQKPFLKRKFAKSMFLFYYEINRDLLTLFTVAGRERVNGVFCNSLRKLGPCLKSMFITCVIDWFRRRASICRR